MQRILILKNTKITTVSEIEEPQNSIKNEYKNGIFSYFEFTNEKEESVKTEILYDDEESQKYFVEAFKKNFQNNYY